MHLRESLAALLVALIAAGCSSKNRSSAPTFNLQFSPPPASGYANSSVDAVGFSPTQTVDIVLPAAVTVTGRVTDGAGAAMNNVRVAFRKAASSPDLVSDTTDVSGNYSVLLSAGTWVAVLDPGVDNLGELVRSGVAVSSPNGTVHDFQFPLASAVIGTVFQMGGPAIAGATVAFTGQNTKAKATATADGAGLYAASLVPDTYEAVVTPAGAAAATHLKEKFVGIVVNGQTSRNFQLAAGVQVSGTVRDNLGQALLETTDVEVVLPTGSRFYAPADVATNPANGTYSIGPVPPGSVTFEFTAPGDSGFPRQQFTTSIVGPTTQTHDVALLAGFVLSGIVVQDNGSTPEKDVRVELVPTNGSLAPDDDTTGNAGDYEISVFAGTYTVKLTPVATNLQLPETRTVNVVANTVLNVTLARGAMLQGTVTNGGNPYQDMRVEIAGVTGASAVTDAAGAYAFLAPAGTHVLQLTAESGALRGIALAPQTGVVVALPGPVTQDIALTPASSGSTVVQGTVRAPDRSTPVAGVDIVARHNTTGEVLGRATTTASGTYVLVIP